MAGDVLITGGTGYLGRALIPRLLARGHRVRALVRPGSEKRLPAGVDVITGNALTAGDVARALVGATVLVHLVGVPRIRRKKSDLRDQKSEANERAFDFRHPTFDL